MNWKVENTLLNSCFSVKTSCYHLSSSLFKRNLSAELAKKYNLSKMTMEEIMGEVKAVRHNANH
jgi:hypothetical protein